MPGLTRTTTTIPNQIIFDYTLPPAVLLSYLRLRALLTTPGARQVGPLDFAGELLPILGVKKTQARQHLRLLRMAKLLTWVNDAAGRILITLYGPVDAGAKLPPGGTGKAAGSPVEELSGDLPMELDEPGSGNPKKSPAEVLAGNAVCVDVGDSDSDTDITIQHHPTRAAKPESALALSDEHELPGIPVLKSWPELSTIGLVQELSQVQPPPEDPWTSELADLLADPAFAEAMSWLAQAGVWTDRAIQIARQICAHEKRGQAYLPTRADVLGWIAYCFAFKSENKINKPAQVLAGNLANNRRCPDELRPFRVCARCNFTEGYCQCHAEPEYGFPARYIGYAFNSEYSPRIQTFWGICLKCHVFLCTCLEQEAEEEEPEEEDESDLDQAE